MHFEPVEKKFAFDLSVLELAEYCCNVAVAQPVAVAALPGELAGQFDVPLLLRLNVEVWGLTCHLLCLNYSLWRILGMSLHRLRCRLKWLGLPVLNMSLGLHTVQGGLVHVLLVLLSAQ